MELTYVLTALSALLTLSTTVLGILLKSENDKRMALQQQVAEQKRNAYAKFGTLISTVIAAPGSPDAAKRAEKLTKEITDLRKEIWTFGSDEVVKAYAVWHQRHYRSSAEQTEATGSLALMADVIVKMRQDMGLSKRKSLKPIDILRILITNVEEKYDEEAKAAIKFREQLRSRKHVEM